MPIKVISESVLASYLLDWIIAYATDIGGFSKMQSQGFGYGSEHKFPPFIYYQDIYNIMIKNMELTE